MSVCVWKRERKNNWKNCESLCMSICHETYLIMRVWECNNNPWEPEADSQRLRRAVLYTDPRSAEDLRSHTQTKTMGPTQQGEEGGPGGGLGGGPTAKGQECQTTRGQSSQHELRMGTQTREPPDGADLIRGPSFPIPQPQGSRPANTKIPTQGAVRVLAPARRKCNSQWVSAGRGTPPQDAGRLAPDQMPTSPPKTVCIKQGCRPLLTIVSIKGRPFGSMCWCTSQYE